MNKTLFKNIGWGFLTFIVAVGLFSLLRGETTKPVKLTLSQVAQKIAADEVSKITVKENSLKIDLKDGSEAEARKETEAGLTESLRNLGAETETLQKVELLVEGPSAWQQWLAALLPIMIPLLIIGAIAYYMLRQAKGNVNQAFMFGKSKMRLNTGKDRVTFNDVAGLKEAKEELQEVVEFLKKPKKFQDLGAKIPSGVLLAGHPGTGKTLLARAVAGESGTPFFHISASEFVEMFVGVGASRIRDAFQTARKASPAILFIDEIDAVGRQRGAGVGGGNDEREQTLNQILVELDGFDNDTNVIVLAATNRPDVLDPALLRPGRFDRRVMLDLPAREDRVAIMKIHAKNKPLQKGIDFDVVAARTPGFSGADLANLMNEAAILTAREGKKKVTQLHILESIEKVMLGPARVGRVSSEEDRKITAYHEGGHAIVAASLKHADPVHKVSIVSRGMAGGYTLKIPDNDRSYKHRSGFLADLATLLGGFVSEQLTFGDVTTGSSNDLKEATSLARKIVTQYGMSSLGPITFGKSKDAVFLGRDLGHERDYSEEVASKVDREVARLMKVAQDTAKKVLKKHTKALEAVAETLLKEEILEREEFYEVIKPFKIRPLTIKA